MTYKKRKTRNPSTVEKISDERRYYLIEENQKLMNGLKEVYTVIDRLEKEIKKELKHSRDHDRIRSKLQKFYEASGLAETEIKDNFKELGEPITTIDLHDLIMNQETKKQKEAKEQKKEAELFLSELGSL